MAWTPGKPLVWLKGEVTRIKLGGLSTTLLLTLWQSSMCSKRKPLRYPSDVLTNCKRRLAAYIRVASGSERKQQ